MISIILVEDDADTSRLMVAILDGGWIRGTRVRSRRFGMDLHTAAWLDADLLITDLKLPGELDEVQLVHKLHRLLPEVPTVVTSGCHAELNGPGHQVYWLRKPYTVEQLEAICRALTAGTSPQRQHSQDKPG